MYDNDIEHTKEVYITSIVKMKSLNHFNFVL